MSGNRIAVDVTTDIPFTDIYVNDEIVDEVESVLRSTRYVKGERLQQFEEDFAAKCGVENAVGVSSGTAALLLAMRAAGIEDGDQVFVPGHTFFASVSPILELGAEPVFVDIDPETYVIDTDDLKSAVRAAESPRAILPVHIYGHMADMDRVRQIADEYELLVFEDACQAHFGSRDGHVAGTAGTAGAFSFYPSKNMTVGGDGGMLVTDDDGFAKRARALRNHGRTDDGVHRYLGLNYRLDEMNAVVGHEQLKHIDEWNDARRAAARTYTNRLESVDQVTVPTEAAGVEHVYHLYVIQVPDRDELREFLSTRDIDTGIHYETPAHLHPAVVERVGDVKLPRTERLCDRIVSLPMHPRISPDEIETVCDAIEDYYR